MSQTLTIDEVREFLKGHIIRTGKNPEINYSHKMYRQVLYKLNRLQSYNEKLKQRIETLNKQIEQ